MNPESEESDNDEEGVDGEATRLFSEDEDEHGHDPKDKKNLASLSIEDRVRGWTRPTSALFKIKEKGTRYGRLPQKAQNKLGDIAGIGEKIKNIFNWTHPFQYVFHSYFESVFRVYRSIFLSVLYPCSPILSSFNTK